MLYFWLQNDFYLPDTPIERQYSEESINKKKLFLRDTWCKKAITDKKKAIESLDQRLEVLEYNFQTVESALLLWKIDPGNDRALATFLFFMKDAQVEEDTIDRIIKVFGELQEKEQLTKILSQEQLLKIVALVKNIIMPKDSIQDTAHLDSYYQMIWYCARNLSYPNFYKAWNTV